MARSTRFPKYPLSLPLTLLCAVLLSGLVTLFLLWCQPNAFRGVISIFLHKPILIILNALPIGLLILLFTALLRNVWFSAALVNLVMGGLSIANRVKIEVRDEPVFPRDLALLKEVGSAMGSYDIRIPWKAIIVWLLLSMLLAAIGTVLTTKPFPLSKLRGWPGRILGAGISLAALVLATTTLLASDPIYQSLSPSNPYRLSTVFNETGFPYNFFHQFTTFLVDKPEGFQRAEAERWETGDRTGLGQNVHVVMVMNEAFSDLSDEAAFAYSAENDPLTNLHALQQDPHAISGHLIVPGFAGGTANTEFDVLTGMQTNALSATTTSALRVIDRDLDSLFRVYANDGYHTSFFHPGDDWFYNRENVYRWFGAEETRFADEMTDIDYKGRWVTDDYMASLIEQTFADTVASGELLFHYTTTIQNHMAYVESKYGDGYTYPEVPLSVPVSEEVETMLEVYMEGARDSDAMLGRLKQYFENRSEPVVLVFFGDHLPYLGDNQLGYAELGSQVAVAESQREDLFRSYETPYVIWANDAAAETLDWEATVSQLGLSETGDISASFLGALVLELTGRTEESPWFDFLNTLRRDLPVVQKRSYELPDGTIGKLQELDDTPLAEQIAKWRRWSYYKLRYKDIPS